MSSQKVINFRKRRKEWAVKAFGGKCGICGYSKCIQALHFHHLDPSTKKFGVSSSTSDRDTYIEELRKCICVCSNCHSEIHSGIVIPPENVTRFNEDYVNKQILEKPKHPCKYCGKLTLINQKYCSLNCSCKDRQVINWPTITELKQLVLSYGYSKTGRLLGVSDNAIRKRIKRNIS